jgi:hypothetical protein
MLPYFICDITMYLPLCSDTLQGIKLKHQIISEVIHFWRRQKVLASLSCPWHQGHLHAAIRPWSDRIRTRLWGSSRVGATLREEGPSQAEAPGTGSYLQLLLPVTVSLNCYFYVVSLSLALRRGCSNRLSTLAEAGWLAALNLILLTWTIWRSPTNASKWRMGFNSTFKGLTEISVVLKTGFRDRLQNLAKFKLQVICLWITNTLTILFPR